MGEPQAIRLEALFLKNYEAVRMFPSIMFIGPGYDRYELEGRKQWGKWTRWGRAEYPASTWKDFLLSNVIWSKDVIGTQLSQEDFELVKRLTISPNRTPRDDDHFLIHGNCGLKNVLFEGSNLACVINPWPVYGPPIHDLVSAFCSTPDSLNWNTIRFVANHLLRSLEDQLLIEEVIIGLYQRISTCIEYHPEDLSTYLEAWFYWVNKYNSL